MLVISAEVESPDVPIVEKLCCDKISRSLVSLINSLHRLRSDCVLYVIHQKMVSSPREYLVSEIEVL